MSVQQVRKCCREFEDECADVQDYQHSGWPSVSDETITKVEEALLKYQRVRVRNLCEMIPNVSKSCIHKIVIDLLGYAKVCARIEEELKEEVLSYLRGTAEDIYNSGMKKMVHRMQKCIDLNGDYVEK
ncbi:histone-lysine N-methyltransferase SETMAR [Nephila pilipes]|uniref:Histone-lysine N-methyltransferase SETMAR n=1 Tax=Nephila pilipes TaxID=299642 RepID=A0A8X6TUZ6_NEPPI|nr:histone-lysine N-methyltransferase SETMAR [Nephila pilipes]